MTPSCVRHERHGRVLVIRIEREAKRNAIDASTTRGIDEALNLLEDDDQLWAGVITGTTAVFSAGTDLRDGTGSPAERGGEYGMIRRRRTKPADRRGRGPGARRRLRDRAGLRPRGRLAHRAVRAPGEQARSGRLFRCAVPRACAHCRSTWPGNC